MRLSYIIHGDWLKKGELGNFLYRKKVLSNGQSALYALYTVEDEDTLRNSIVYVYVLFGIADKYKTLVAWALGEGHGDLDITATGKCGLEGLKWALENTLLAANSIRHYNEDHEEYRKTFGHRYKKVRLIIAATTPQRYRIYKRALIPHGFKESRDGYGLYLYYE